MQRACEDRARAREAISTPQYSAKLPVVSVRALNNHAMTHFGELQLDLLKKLETGELNRQDAQYEVEKYWVGSLRDGAVDGAVVHLHDLVARGGQKPGRLGVDDRLVVRRAPDVVSSVRIPGAVAIRIADLDDSSLQARRICPIRLVLCASPEYLADFGAPSTPDDLSDHRILRYDAGGNQPLRLQDRDGKTHTVNARSPIIANNGDFLRDMAAAGHGIYATPTFIAWEAIRDGRLVTVLDDFPQPELSAWAVYPQNRYLSRRARAFIDFLVDRFGDEPYWDDCLSGL